VSADPTPGQPALRPYEHVRPRQRLVTACGWAALLTGAAAIWVATELGITGAGWLPWLACALPPATAGLVCLGRRPATSTGPAAVFASCSAAGGVVLQVPEGQHGVRLVAAMLLLLCAGVSVFVSAPVTAIMISISGTISRRRAVAWTAAGLVFTAVSIPSPVYVTGGPIQTIFAGNTTSENAVTVFSLLLIAVPLLMTGLASGPMATVMVVAWLPEAAAVMLGWYVLRLSFLRPDAWYYASWLVWLAIAALALAEARGWRSGRQSPMAAASSS
jgi:hypothetical protein